jgi:carboxyl-terminal processing protease
VVLGGRSYGKGTVQKLIPIESGRSLLKLTSAHYLRPNGKNIHRSADADDSDDWGVSPNPGHEVPLSDEEYEAYVKYRSARDLWGEPPPKELLPAEDGANSDEVAEDAADSAADADFVDRPLDAAMEHLESVLDAEKSA